MRIVIFVCLIVTTVSAPLEEIESNPMLGNFFGGDMLGVFTNVTKKIEMIISLSEVKCYTLVKRRGSA
jgi:hypothetical protein